MSLSDKTAALGKVGQDCVEKYLLDQGFTIIGRNFTVKVGELDLVATKNELVCFVEVKTRREQYFPICSVVTKTKQQKLEKAAKWFVARNKIVDKVLRFDVATVIFADKYAPIINYLESAFYAGGSGHY